MPDKAVIFIHSLSGFMFSDVPDLHDQVKNCTFCQDLPLGPNPIFFAPENAKLVLIGQAPGTKVHHSGIPWNDPSGDKLREWLQLSPEQFYENDSLAIIPMGFCYPGKGKSGDLPPRKECAPLWHNSLMQPMKKLEYRLLIGSYAIRYYLKEKRRPLSDLIANQFDKPSEFLLLVHPSPRNRRWLKNNPWFEKDIIPAIREIVSRTLEKRE